MDQNRQMREDNDYPQIDTGPTVLLPHTNDTGHYQQTNPMFTGNGSQPVGGPGAPQWQVGPQTQGQYGAAQGPFGATQGTYGTAQGPVSGGRQAGSLGQGPYGGVQGPGVPGSYAWQNGPQGPQEPGSLPPKKNTSAIVIAVIAAVLLLGGVIFAVYYFVLRDKKDNTTDSSVTVTAEENLSGGTGEDAGTAAVTEEGSAAPTTAVPATVPPASTQATAPPVTYPSPVISYASTVRGEVLESSNVSSNRSFGADKMIDGYADTCWCVNTDSDGGVGATVTIVLRETSLVSGIGIINGNLYMPQDDIYRSNGQLRDFTLTFSDNSTMRFSASNNSNASNSYQYFAFSSPVVTDRITLRVDSAYVGAKYTSNVCIGEITVY